MVFNEDGCLDFVFLKTLQHVCCSFHLIKNHLSLTNIDFYETVFQGLLGWSALTQIRGDSYNHDLIVYPQFEFIK